MWGALLAMAGLFSTRAALAQARYDAGNERYEQAQLPNGLRVFMAEDHRAPLVAIVIRYPVGARQDPQEARGTAELLAKLLPELKTSHLPQGPSDLIEAAGFYPWSVQTGSGDEDTSLRVVVPAEAVDLALFIEAERMGFASDGITSERMTSVANDIVRQFTERTGDAGNIGLLTALAYGPLHSFAAVTRAPDFSKLDLAWLRRRLRRFYNPSVARLSIVGDFDSKRLLPVVERTFGLLKGQPLPAQPASPVASAPHRGELRAPDATPATVWSWRSPRYMTADDIALDVVARYLRHTLSQKLGSSQKRAGVWARQLSQDSGSVFWLHLPASTEAERSAAEQASRAELDAIAAGKVDVAELDVAKTSIIREISDSMDSLVSRARFLTTYGMYDGKLDQFDAHLKSYATLDAARFSDVVRRLLGRPDGTLMAIQDTTAKGRVLSGFEPPTYEGVRATDDVSSPDAPAWYKPPTAIALPRFDVPRIAEATVGKTRLLFMPRSGLPTIRLRLALNWRLRSPASLGRGLLLNTLLGARPDGKPTLQDRLIDLGAQLQAHVDDDTLSLTATTVVDRADAVMTALRESLEPERLEQQAFDTAREDALKSLSKKQSNDSVPLDRWAGHLAYRKGHRYRIGAIDEATRQEAIKAITLKQLESLWTQERRAEGVTVSIVGPIDEARAQELTRLGTPHFRAGATVASSPVRVAPRTFLIDAPEAKEVRVRFAWPVTAWGSQGFVDAIGLRWALGDIESAEQDLAANGVKHAHDWSSDSFAAREDSGITLTMAVPKEELTGLFKAVTAYIARLGRGEIAWHDEQEARRAAVQWVTDYFDDAQDCLKFLAIHADLEVPKQAGDDIYVLARRMGRASLAKAVGMLAPEKATVVAYGPIAELEPSLAGLGFAPTSVVPLSEGKAP